MKQTLGIYLMFAGILMGFYLLFGVYLPAKMPARPVIARNVSDEAISSGQLHAGDRHVAPAVAVAPRDDMSDITNMPTYQHTNTPVVLAKYERSHKAHRTQKLFDVPEGLKTEVEFWKKIYTVYTSDEAVLHDPDDLGRVYSVIPLPHCDEPPTTECLKLREDAIQAEKDRIIERLFPTTNDQRPTTSIRAQVGQKDKFEAGILASKKYLGKIEKIFDEYGVPREISRLAFVESMFDLKAYSRSRAAGIWQLMPSTAKIFGLKVSRKLDERYDPIKSTYVAAKHLLRDYKRLGSWALAINAYNAGPGRLANAVSQIGTKDIVKIVKNYSSPAYGFAARNFYPCFLAALSVYENRDQYFRYDSNATVVQENPDEQE